jgi:hypothetical protein
MADQTQWTRNKLYAALANVLDIVKNVMISKFRDTF